MKDKVGNTIRADLTMSLVTEDLTKIPLQYNFSTENISLLDIDKDTMVLNISGETGISISITFRKDAI